MRGLCPRDIFFSRIFLLKIKYLFDGFRPMQASLNLSIFSYDCPDGTCVIPGTSTGIDS